VLFRSPRLCSVAQSPRQAPRSTPAHPHPQVVCGKNLHQRRREASAGPLPGGPAPSPGPDATCDGRSGHRSGQTGRLPPLRRVLGTTAHWMPAMKTREERSDDFLLRPAWLTVALTLCADESCPKPLPQLPPRSRRSDLFRQPLPPVGTGKCCWKQGLQYLFLLFLLFRHTDALAHAHAYREYSHVGTVGTSAQVPSTTDHALVSYVGTPP
jgi:hypothetical protein